MSGSLKNDEVLLQQVRSQLGLEADEAKEVLGYLDTFTDKGELSSHLQGMLGDGETTDTIIQRAISTKFLQGSSASEKPLNSPGNNLYSGIGSTPSTPSKDSPKLSKRPETPKKSQKGADPVMLKSQFYRKGDKEDILEEYKVSRKSKPVTPIAKQSGAIAKEESFQEKPQSSTKKETSKPIKVRDNRKECACFGLKHDVFLNCLVCGRIACKNEGAGPCFFCKFPLLSMEQQRQDHQTFRDVHEELKAHSHLERLLEFDRTSAARTKVIDQASDYSIPDILEPEDQWLNSADKLKAIKLKKEKLEAIEQQKRGPRVLSLDLENRKVSVAPLVFKPKEIDEDLDTKSPTSRDGITFRKSELPRAKYIPPPEENEEQDNNDSKSKSKTKSKTKYSKERRSDIEIKRAELRVSYLDELSKV